MANPAADIKAKVTAKYPDAVVSGRGRRYLEHSVPSIPGKRVLHTRIGSVHYGAGEDQEINTAWQVGTAPWDYEMVAAGYNAYALQRFDAGQIVKYVHPATGEDLAFQPQQLQYTNDLDQIQAIEDPQNINAVVTDDVLYWTGAFGTDIDFKWEAQPSILDKRLIIKNLAALPAVQQFIIDGGNPVLCVQFIFQKSSKVEIWVNDVLWDEKAVNPVTTSGIIEWKHEDTGEVLWSFHLPLSFEEDQRGFIGTFKLRRTGPNLFVEHRVPVDWLQSASYPIEIDTTVNEAITDNDDDGREKGTDWDAWVGEFGRDNNVDMHGGFRFQAVAIPNAATIDSAYFRLTATSNQANTPDMEIYADDVDDSAVWSDADRPSQRTKTTAYVAWTHVSWTADVEYSSGDIKTVIQEIVDRGGWATGQDLSIIHWCVDTDAYSDKVCYMYYQSSTKCAQLDVEYTEAAAGNPWYYYEQQVGAAQ